MEPRKPTALGLALLYLRSMAGIAKTKLAPLVKVSEDVLGRYEKGDTLSREKLEEILRPLGQPPEAIDVLVFAHDLIAPEVQQEPASPVALTAQERRRIDRLVLAAAWSLADMYRSALVRQRKADKAAAAHRLADEQWIGMEGKSLEERRRLVALFPVFQTWALALRVCQASIRAAAHKPADALELARLALFIAERIPGDEGFRTRLQGLVHGFIANAWRVLEDYVAADAAFARAWVLWNAGSDPEELLPEWRLLDLEASLRRDQRRFAESLALLDRALAACGAGTTAAGRILLNKESALAQMGDFSGALLAIAEAAPLIEAAGDPRLLFGLRFNMVDDLYHLERFQEAEALLPKARELAVEQANDLDLLRVLWLESRVAAGLGRGTAAIEGFEQVRATFTLRKLPYDAALSSLDLAVLWLGLGRTTEVRELAAGMKWIFEAKGIHTEALAALRLFAEAAKEEAATIGLTRKVIADIERVRRMAPLLREKRGRKV